MTPSTSVLIFGASARAATFSALRAGLEPWCADLFADADLIARCPVIRVPGKNYPHGFLDLVRRELPGAWMYTGGLENYPELIRRMSRKRPLWGNDYNALIDSRLPSSWTGALDAAGCPRPAFCVYPYEEPGPGRWLAKPFGTAGGRGIQPWDRPARHRKDRVVCLQEFIEGDSCAAVYIGDGKLARLLGVTRQLVGADWLHAGPFAYCGSIGPLGLDRDEPFVRLGNALAAGCGLRGVFGIDCMIRGGVPYPVEINPRYTASVEVLEHATGIPILALHRRVFEPAAPERERRTAVPRIVGKAILFARAALTFPEDGPWLVELRQPRDVAELPEFADIPRAGARIETGRPILTFFAEAESVPACETKLRCVAGELDQLLYAEW